MVKRIIRSSIVFWGIITLFPLFYILYQTAIHSDFYHSIFGISDGVARVTAWLDSNANGIRDQGEPPLPGVCIWYGYRPDSKIQDYADPCQFEDHDATDEQGQWGLFLPGGSCDIVYVFAKPPTGFQPTTDLASNGCSAQFGFVQEGIPVSHKVLSIGEFARRQIATTWAKRIGVGLFILAIASIGTIWLERRAK
jgi:hypothetical protein